MSCGVYYPVRHGDGGDGAPVRGDAHRGGDRDARPVHGDLHGDVLDRRGGRVHGDDVLDRRGCDCGCRDDGGVDRRDCRHDDGARDGEDETIPQFSPLDLPVE